MSQTGQKIRFDADRNVAELGGQSMVFHCHFYNCTLQRAVEAGMGEEKARVVLRDSALASVRSQLAQACPEGASSSEVLATAASLFTQLGFGRMAPFVIDARGGEVIVTSSHYAMGWLSIYGERKDPACRFVEGFLSAAVSVALRTSAPVVVTEHRCFACGHDDCRFQVEVKS